MLTQRQDHELVRNVHKIKPTTLGRSPLGLLLMCRLKTYAPNNCLSYFVQCSLTTIYLIDEYLDGEVGDLVGYTYAVSIKRNQFIYR